MGAVKDVLAERSKAFQNWRHAQSMVAKKKEQRARLEMSGRADKVFDECSSILSQMFAKPCLYYSSDAGC